MPTVLDTAQRVTYQFRQRSAGMTEPGVPGGLRIVTALTAAAS